MADVFMTDPVTGRAALYEEPIAAGDPSNPNSARNAPLNNPNANMQYVYYHSDFDPMEVVIGPSEVTINHASIAPGSGPGAVASFSTVLVYGNVVRDHVLLTHNLGYAPVFFVVVDGHAVHGGFPVQYVSSDGRTRCVTPYATDTVIGLREFGIQTSNTLPAISVTYSVLVIGRPPAPVGNVLLDFEPLTGVVSIARGKFRSDRYYLQIVDGGSPFAFPLGPTIDLNNGTFRSVSPTIGARDPVPATFRVAFGESFGAPAYGPTGEYKGAFAGSDFVQVQAP